MAFTGKFTTLYNIIEEVRRDGFGGFTEEEAKEWIWAAVSLLGIPYHYVDKIQVIEVDQDINEPRVELPYDLYDMTEGGIRDYETKKVLLKEENIYYNMNDVGNTNGVLGLGTIGESVVYINGIKQTDVDSYVYPNSSIATNMPKYTYKINNGFIYLGYKPSKIEISYKAFPVDNNGDPMIEDNAKVIRAVVSYIKRKIVARMFLNDEITLQKKEIIDREAMWHMASAKSEASIGSVDDWETVRSRWLRLRRDPNLHRIGFDGYGSREQLKL